MTSLTTSAQIAPRKRPTKPQGEVFRRYDETLDMWISFRTLEIEQDLALYHRWQNIPRVAAFWDEAHEVSVHQAHLEQLAADPHCLQLIGCFNDEPFGFFDVYWALEDRLGAYYEAEPYDRGLHMLVGEAHHRGPHKVASWLPALMDYMWDDDPRTGRLVSEPRADNAKMIGYLQQFGFERVGDVDFPHKRAALMMCHRGA